MKYDNLEQRTADKYRELFPDFIPEKQDYVSISEQKQFYEIMKNLYQLAYEEPSLFVTSLHDDDITIFQDRERYNKSKIHMRKFVQAVYDLIHNMFLMGQNFEVKLSKKQKEILLKLGINDFNNLPAAWIWMSTRPNADINEFFYCLFKKNYSYGFDIYSRIFGEEAFHKLESRLITKGYKRFDSFSMTAGFPVIDLSYVNMNWSEEQPQGFYSKVKHTGVSTAFFYYNEYPAVFGLHIPNDIVKTCLEGYNLMSKSVQGFVINHHTKCWDCRYCVQTDKTGLRPQAFIPIVYEQNEYNLCPRFPGYAYNWKSINDDLADNIIDTLTFIDSFEPNHTCVTE